jgi:glycerol kinase
MKTIRYEAQGLRVVAIRTNGTVKLYALEQSEDRAGALASKLTDELRNSPRPAMVTRASHAVSSNEYYFAQGRVGLCSEEWDG